MNRELLAAVLAHPQDDLPRLLLADWLEDHAGTWRDDGSYARGANAIRLGIAEPLRTVNMPNRLYHWAALAGGAGNWFPPLSGAEVPGGYVVRRGFVESVSCRLADWLQHGPAVVLEHPITTVRITDCIPLDPPRGTWSWYIPGSIHERAAAVIPQLRDRYDSVAEAEADLSAACIAWAKDQAPSIPETTEMLP